MKLFKIFIMLYKSKLYISVFILATCLGLIPIGFLVNGYVKDQIPAKTPDALLGIQGEVIPEIEAKFIGLGIPETLESIRIVKKPEVTENIVETEAIPQTLLFLRNRTIGKLYLIINASATARVIDEALNNVSVSVGMINAREHFFNNFNFSAEFSNFTQIQGVSEYNTLGNSSLSFSGSTQTKLVVGTTYNDVVYPGIISDLETGMGVIQYLDFYEKAQNQVGNARVLIQAVYSCTWNSRVLQNFTNYIKSYIWRDIAVKEYEPLSLETYADSVFYSQWANGSLTSKGLLLDFLVEELADELKAAITVDKIYDVILRARYKPPAENNETLARFYYFNDNNFKVNFSSAVEGISEVASNGDYSLNFTLLAVERILDGYEDYPGLLTEISTGFGLLRWMDLYTLATADNVTRDLMISVYNATWDTQLKYIGTYIKDYMYSVIIASESIIGLEVGVPVASNIRNSTTLDLWDPTNINSIVNTTGIRTWYDASKGNITLQNQLNASFSLNQTQFDLLYEWLFSYLKEELVPIFFTFIGYHGYRVTPSEYAEVLILVQWANATIYPKGMDLGGGLKGFEAGIPIPINTSLAITTALFDPKNKSGFVNKDGLLKWIDAYNNDSTVQTELKTIFQLNDIQLGIITNWLFNILKVNVVSFIVENHTIYTMTALAGFAFYRQWANGSLFRDGLDPGPALGLDSLKGWELGIPVASGIKDSFVRRMWNRNYDLAFVNSKGIAKWFKAIEIPSTYNYLKETFDLTNTQMDAILDWLPMIRDKYAISLLQIESGLQIDHYELAKIYFTTIFFTSCILSSVSVLAIIWVLLSKRKSSD